MPVTQNSKTNYSLLSEMMLCFPVIVIPQGWTAPFLKVFGTLRIQHGFNVLSGAVWQQKSLKGANNIALRPLLEVYTSFIFLQSTFPFPFQTPEGHYKELMKRGEMQPFPFLPPKSVVLVAEEKWCSRHTTIRLWCPGAASACSLLVTVFCLQW